MLMEVLSLMSKPSFLGEKRKKDSELHSKFANFKMFFLPGNGQVCVSECRTLNTQLVLKKFGDLHFQLCHPTFCCFKFFF